MTEPTQECIVNPGSTCPPCLEAYHLDRQILDARQLKAQKEPLKPLLNQHHDPFIHRLPLELASRIFQFCSTAIKLSSRNYDDDQLERLDGRSQSPDFNSLVLGAICHYWRTVAFSSPRLWSTISISMFRDEDEVYLPLVQEWLDRSATLPLHIRFETRYIYKLIELLNQHAPRWRVLDATIPTVHLPQFRCDTKEQPLLDKLRICVFATPFRSNIEFDLGVRPALSVLHITSIRVSNFRIDFHKLTNVEFDILSDVELLGLLEGAPLLQTVRVHGSLYQDKDDSSARDLAISTSLRQLHVQLHTPYIWESLTIPSLRKLTVDNVPHRAHHEVPWTRIHAFLRRSLSSLTQVQITAKDADYPVIFNILRDFNTLERLVIRQLTLPESFFQFMHGVDEDGLKDTELFLPRLEYLEYRDIRKFEWPWISSLLPPTALNPGRNIRPLKNICLSFAGYDSDVPHYIDEDTLDRISDANATGVVINISESLGINHYSLLHN